MNPSAEEPIAIALTGDVMTGRGIDQILPHPGNPALEEAYVRDARDYVALAAGASGAFPRPVDFGYPWGEALAELGRCDVRLVNLETSITAGGERWPAKGIHYRMHPANVGCLRAARLECCGLANNHVLDWGRSGLADTLRTLREAGIAVSGAGENAAAAAAPAVLDVARRGRVLFLAAGSPDSGIPIAWAATERESGVNVIKRLTVSAAREMAQALLRASRPDDVSVVSIHWGGNWGYEIPEEQIAFAHALADEGIDVIHGHSSHHAKAIELRRSSVILYGCGDFLNDYEGITGHEEFRGDLAVLYRVKARTAPRRRLELALRVFRVERMRLVAAGAGDVAWLRARLDERSARFGATLELGAGGWLTVRPR